MSIIRINTEKPVQKFEINGDTFEVRYDDEAFERYQEAALKFSDKAKKKLKKNATKQEAKKYEMAMKSAVKEIIETFFGDGSFDKIYKTSGKSIIAMTPVVEGLYQWLHKKTSAEVEPIAEYYTE